MMQNDLFYQDIVFEGRLYRAYRPGMEDGFDRVKSGERRPYGWGHYLFEDGYVVFDAETRQFVASVRDLPRELRGAP